MLYRDGMNAYRYCRDNPVVFVDPTGTTGRAISADAAKEFVSTIMNAHGGKAAFVMATMPRIGGVSPVPPPAIRIDIQNLGDLITKLRAVKAKYPLGVAVLEIHGNGNPAWLSFGSPAGLNTPADPKMTEMNAGNAYSFGRAIKPYLACPAVIILYGCNTGNSKGEEKVASTKSRQDICVQASFRLTNGGRVGKRHECHTHRVISPAEWCIMF
jgi:hypothetical protein